MNRAPADSLAKAGLVLLVVLAVSGCQTPSGAPDAPPVPFRLDRKKSVEITPVDEEFNQQRATADSAHRTRKDKNSRTREEMTEGELYALPKFTVTRKGFLNFGLSVVTNSQVALGGSIEWMRSVWCSPDRRPRNTGCSPAWKSLRSMVFPLPG